MFLFKKKKSPKPIIRFIDTFINERRKRYPVICHDHVSHLNHFVSICDCDITDISMYEFVKYRKIISETYSSRYMQWSAMKSLKCFLRFWRGRGHRYLPNPENVPELQVKIK
jgi:hypothetical protein